MPLSAVPSSSPLLQAAADRLRCTATFPRHTDGTGYRLMQSPGAVSLGPLTGHIEYATGPRVQARFVVDVAGVGQRSMGKCIDDYLLFGIDRHGCVPLSQADLAQFLAVEALFADAMKNASASTGDAEIISLAGEMANKMPAAQGRVQLLELARADGKFDAGSLDKACALLRDPDVGPAIWQREAIRLTLLEKCNSVVHVANLAAAHPDGLVGLLAPTGDGKLSLVAEVTARIAEELKSEQASVSATLAPFVTWSKAGWEFKPPLNSGGIGEPILQAAHDRCLDFRLTPTEDKPEDKSLGYQMRYRELLLLLGCRDIEWPAMRDTLPEHACQKLLLQCQSSSDLARLGERLPKGLHHYLGLEQGPQNEKSVAGHASDLLRHDIAARRTKRRSAEHLVQPYLNEAGQLAGLLDPAILADYQACESASIEHMAKETATVAGCILAAACLILLCLFCFALGGQSSAASGSCGERRRPAP